jgi:hypothetical protein
VKSLAPINLKLEVFMTFQFTKEEINRLKTVSSIAELSNLINRKTDQKFSLVQTKLVQELNEKLLDNIFCINRLNEYLYNNWKELIKTNQDITNKWKNELKPFKVD